MKMQIKGMPEIKSSVFKSKDGLWIVHKTILTDIKSSAYYNAVLNGAPFEELPVLEEEILEE